MKKSIKLISTVLFLILLTYTSYSQSDQVKILNDVITALKGEQGNLDVKTFSTIKEVCNSRYITCDQQGRIEGLDFQFANLNGYIPEEINQLVDLEYINLTFNYLDGVIPNGLSQMPKLEELSIRGNFLEGPLPKDISQLSKTVDIDLTQNTFKNADPKWVNRLNITNQFNLEGCRSPDSIFLSVDIRDKTSDKILDSVKPKVENKKKNVEKDETLKRVESMPRFPGCEEQGISEEERHKCAQNKMLQFIYKNLRYPHEARTQNIEGMVVVQFVILKNGDIGGATVKRDPGGRCGNAALWIVNRMNFICDKWIPGMQDGDSVKVLYTLPVKFKLEG